MVTREEYEALLRRVELLEGHQHSYTAPRNANLTGTWATTGPRRDTGGEAAAAYLKQMRESKAKR